MKLQTVCLFVSVVLVVVQCQVLDFTKQLTPDDISCGHLLCAANNSQVIISISIYNTTEKDNPMKLAFISVFAPEVSVDSSKIHIINATGTTSMYEGVLIVRFLRDIDCLYGAFQCELGFVNIKGQPDVITKNLAPATEENANIWNSLTQISTQLLGLKQDNEVLKQDNEVLKQDNEVLKQDIKVLKQDIEVVKSSLDSVLVELSSIKGLLNSGHDNDQQYGSFCYRGMPHKSSREKFFLHGKLLALCDTETDGGGWIIIQRRVRGDVDFYRGWDDYKKGFGTPDTDLWIGNDIIHNLTTQGYNELRIDFVYNGTQYFAQYTNFIVADESAQYLMTIGGYFGNVYDSMNYHNGYKFSTFDRDNDPDSGNCAVHVHGAWWYNWCYKANLNGAWAVTNLSGISWYFESNDNRHNLSFTEMKIRNK